MSRIFITGSADGLGMLAARILVKEGHEVVLHARNKERGIAAMQSVPGAETVLTADLSSIEETIQLAYKVNSLGHFDAVIHNAGVGYKEPVRVQTVNNLPQVFAVNSLAPYILSCLIDKPERLIFLSSGLHKGGDAGLKDLEWNTRVWNGLNAYSDSKLHDAMLAFYIARRWKDVLSNAVEPGWVATKMGGTGATDDLKQGPVTQAWLAAGTEPASLVTGSYLYHLKPHAFLPAVADPGLQDKLLTEFARISGIDFPA